MAERKYLDETGLGTVWAKIKDNFVRKTKAEDERATKCKITFNLANGLVISGENLAASDIPSLTMAKISDAGTAAKSDVCTTAIAAASTDTNLPTAAQVAAFVEGKGYKTTDNDTTYTFTGGTNEFTVTPSGGTAQTVKITPSIADNALTSTTISGTVTGSTSGTAGVTGTVGAPAVTVNKKTVTDALGYTPVNESKTAAASGTALSLVTTGEKATWNGKQDAITSTNKLSSSLVSGLGDAAAKGVDTSITLDTTSTNLPTSAAVAGLVSSSIAAADAMVYKGTLGTGGTITALPNTTAKIGWTYKVITAGTYDGKVCEEGDMIICLTAGSSSKNATWTVVQNNIDGAVTGPASATSGHYAVFDGATGKVIKDGGAIFTHPTGKTLTSGLYKITVDANGHVTAGTAVVKADITSIGIPGQDTDTKVTAVGNHYTPTGGTAQSVPSSTTTSLTLGTSTVITSVTIDAAGHVTSVGGGKLPSIDTHRALTTDEINAILV